MSYLQMHITIAGKIFFRHTYFTDNPHVIIYTHSYLSATYL